MVWLKRRTLISSIAAGVGAVEKVDGEADAVDGVEVNSSLK